MQNSSLLLNNISIKIAKLLNIGTNPVETEVSKSNESSLFESGRRNLQAQKYLETLNSGIDSMDSKLGF